MCKEWKDVIGRLNLYEERDLIKFLENITEHDREKVFKRFGFSKDNLRVKTVSKKYKTSAV